MPNNPDKRPCVYPGCRAWARRDAKAPYCASHFHLAASQDPAAPPLPRPGAPPGNQNRLLHGFYSHTLHPDEAGDLGKDVEASDLDAEIFITRVALRRTLIMLNSGTTPGEHGQPLSVDQYIRLIDLIFRGTRTIARLYAVRHTLGTGDSRLTQAINEALDELSAEWDIDL